MSFGTCEPPVQVFWYLKFWTFSRRFKQQMCVGDMGGLWRYNFYQTNTPKPVANISLRNSAEFTNNLGPAKILL